MNNNNGNKNDTSRSSSPRTPTPPPMTSRQARLLGLLTTPDPQPRRPNEEQEAAESLLAMSRHNTGNATATDDGSEPEIIQEIHQNTPGQRTDRMETLMRQAQTQPGVPINWRNQLTIQWPPREPLPRPPKRKHTLTIRPVSPTSQASGSNTKAQDPAENVRQEADRAIKAAVDLAMGTQETEPLPNIDNDNEVEAILQANLEEDINAEIEPAILQANLEENMNAGIQPVVLLDMANVVLRNHDDNGAERREVVPNPNVPQGAEEGNLLLLGDDGDEVREVFNAPITPPTSPDINNVGQPEELLMPEGPFDIRFPVPGRRNNIHGEVQNLPVRGGPAHYVPNPYGNRPHQIVFALRGLPTRGQRIYWIQYPLIEVAYRFDLRELDGGQEQRDIFNFYPQQPRRDDEN